MKGYVLITLFLFFSAPAALLAQGASRPPVLNNCAMCHQINEGQAVGKVSAPPLFFAGNKFRKQWLVDWLQSPYRIRPSGSYYADHVKTDDGVDSVDESSLQDHMAVGADTANEIAEWLMTLTPYTDLASQSEDYEPGSVSPRLGAMDFVKFKGCGGCHRDTPEYGGLSGPELYTAWQRLKPEYIVSYIKSPQSWDSNSAMPNRGLNDDQIYKLANYLRTIGQEE